mgnify:CR=1 FL=1
MEFFGLLLINIFIGVIFYLVITLKLEKSASDFREKRLREEMDKIIQEFNATAERNISILESKIRTMKALLERTGELKKFDQIIGDENILDKTGGDDNVAAAVLTPEPVAAHAVQQPLAKPGLPVKSAITKAVERMSVFIDKIFITIEKMNTRRSSSAGDVHPDMLHYTGNTGAGQVKLSDAENIPVIEKNLIDVESLIAAQQNAESKDRAVTPEDAAEIMSQCKDRYSVISQLHERGCPEKDIAEYTGIPVGEIRLILNLNSSL